MCGCNKNKNITLTEFPQNLKQLSTSGDNSTLTITKYVFTPGSGINLNISDFKPQDLLDLTALKIRSKNSSSFKLEVNNNTRLLHRKSGVGPWTVLAVLTNYKTLEDKNFIFFK